RGSGFAATAPPRQIEAALLYVRMLSPFALLLSVFLTAVGAARLPARLQQVRVLGPQSFDLRPGFCKRPVGRCRAGQYFVLDSDTGGGLGELVVEPLLETE